MGGQGKYIYVYEEEQGDEEDSDKVWTKSEVSHTTKYTIPYFSVQNIPIIGFVPFLPSSAVFWIPS